MTVKGETGVDGEINCQVDSVKRVKRVKRVIVSSAHIYIALATRNVTVRYEFTEPQLRRLLPVCAAEICSCATIDSSVRQK